MAACVAHKKRNHLTLAKKVEVIKMAEKKKIGITDLALAFNCGRTQIADILKKESILTLYSSNASKDRVLVRSKHSEYSKLNKVLHNWYTLACSKNIIPVALSWQKKLKR